MTVLQPTYNSRQEIARSTVRKLTAQACLLFACFLWQGALSQEEPPAPPRLNFPQPPGDNNNPNVPPDLRKDMQKKANEQRQAELKRDTERLLKLSTELKEYVDKSNENVLSLDVIKKADEIEKLAHNVKQKMRGDN
jgi:hypothetical protein